MNVTTCEPLSYDTAAGDMPEASRQPAREVCKPGAHFPESTAVPNVLLIGDSVASGYESFVRDELMGVAQVQLSPWLFSNNPVDGAGEPGYFAMCAQPSSQAAFSCSFACGGAAHSSAQHGGGACSAAGAPSTCCAAPMAHHCGRTSCGSTSGSTASTRTRRGPSTACATTSPRTRRTSIAWRACSRTGPATCGTSTRRRRSSSG